MMVMEVVEVGVGTGYEKVQERGRAQKKINKAFR
jgi:hypothetical protein